MTNFKKKKHFKKLNVTQHLDKKGDFIQDYITQKIIVVLKVWRSLHSIIFSSLLEFSNATYSDIFNDLIHLGLIPPEEVSK